MQKPAHIVVGLSGGVDSAVAALLLKEQGHPITGIFMQNWEADQEDPHCTAHQDLTDARAVCDKLHIPLQTVNFAKQYWDAVFQYCLDEYAKGRTPNPDVLCNREIKFKALLDHALQLGADYLATGHYAGKNFNGNTWELCKAADLNKDQSYFLYLLNQKALEKSLFPLGTLTKPQVRSIAKKAGFLNYDKKDSTGICFVGERRFKPFLKEFLLARRGEMRTPEGRLLGHHDGIMFYTLGQRKGLEIGGQKNSEEKPWYVADKMIETNTLIVVQGNDHPLLHKKYLTAEDMHWIGGQPPQFPYFCSAKTRYRQANQPCIITPKNEKQFSVEFTEPQFAPTPGQSIVFYQATVCLGGGIIAAV